MGVAALAAAVLQRTSVRNGHQTWLMMWVSAVVVAKHGASITCRMHCGRWRLLCGGPSPESQSSKPRVSARNSLFVAPLFLVAHWWTVQSLLALHVRPPWTVAPCCRHARFRHALHRADRFGECSNLQPHWLPALDALQCLSDRIACSSARARAQLLHLRVWCRWLRPPLLGPPLPARQATPAPGAAPAPA